MKLEDGRDVISDYLYRYEKYHAGQYLHYCPACDSVHAFAVDQPFSNGARWSFDGNVEKPTFNPSMNIRSGPYPQDGRIEVCHYFLHEGVLKYCGDCTHSMAGQEVPLPKLPDRFKTVY